MSLEAELEPKLAEISRLADERFNRYLELNGYMLDHEGLVFPDPAHPERTPPDPQLTRMQALRAEWTEYSQTLYELGQRFRSFYPLDQPELTAVRNRLGYHPDGGDDTLGQVYSADHSWIRPVGALLGVWRDPQGTGNESTGRVPERRNDTESLSWDGASADAFYYTLLHPFEIAAARQSAYVLELAAAVEMFKTVSTFATEGIKVIADKCINALGGDADVDSGDLGNLSMGLGVAGTLATAVGLAFPPTAVVAGWVGLVAGVGSIWSGLAASAQNEDTSGIDVEVSVGPRMVDALESCLDAIGSLETEIHKKEELIWRGLNDDLSNPASFASRQLWLHRTEEFEDQNFRVSKAADSVVAPVVRLYEAGYKYLPGAAFQYDDALLHLNLATLPAGLQAFFPTSIAKYEEARGLLAHIFTVTRDNLREAGATLVEVARDHELCDEDNARAVRDMGEIDAPTAADH